MNALERYVVGETCKVFLLSAAVALLLLTSVAGVKEGMELGLPPQLVLLSLPFVVPEMLRFVIPSCLLMAVCSVFGRMAAAHEIVALKSLGINPLRIISPVCLLSVALSIVTYSIHDLCARWARPNLRRMVSNSIDEIAYGFLKSQKSYVSDEFSISVKGVEKHTLIEPTVTVPATGGEPPITLTAETAQLRYDMLRGKLRFDCQNGQIEVGQRTSFRFPDRFGHEIPLARDVDDPSRLSPAALPSWSITRQLAETKQVLARHEAHAGFGRMAHEKRKDYLRRRLFRLQAESQRRLANGFACLAFVLLGIPVAILCRSADTPSVFFLSFCPILLLYYPLLVVGETMARRGVLPHLSVWLANGIVVLFGFAILRKAVTGRGCSRPGELIAAFYLRYEWLVSRTCKSPSHRENGNG